MVFCLFFSHDAVQLRFVSPCLLRTALPASQVSQAYPQIAGKELTFGFKVIYADLVRIQLRVCVWSLLPEFAHV